MTSSTKCRFPKCRRVPWQGPYCARHLHKAYRELDSRPTGWATHRPEGQLVAELEAELEATRRQGPEV